MDGTRNQDQTTATEDDGEFSAKEAAELLENTLRQARRNFDFGVRYLTRPLLMMLGGSVILLGYGALWFSVRHQHPYKGPNLAAIAGVYVGIIVVMALTAKVLQRATEGVSGPSRRQMGVEGSAIALAYIAAAVIQGALHAAGASAAIVYGIFPSAGPLVMIGCTLAGITATKQDWPTFAVALAVVSVGFAGLFVSAAASWAVVGIGLFCIALVCVARAWVQGRRPVLA